MQIQIKNRFTSAVIFECELSKDVENLSFRFQLGFAAKKALESQANLSRADLSRANLSWANLSQADLSQADLSRAKKDMFDVLLRAIPEIPLLEKSIIEGRIDGSTYEGECACLCGTIEKSGRFGAQCDMRDSSRPIERFFMGIKKGDTPENNPASKLALEWIQEFKGYLYLIK